MRPIRILTLIVGLVIVRCSDNQSQRVLTGLGYEIESDTTAYPILIDDSAAIIYPFGQMTADKGLKLYYDTMKYSPQGFKIDDSIKEKLSAH